MNRLNLLLSFTLAVILGLLMLFAGRPITPEADLVQQWYATLCDPQANQALIYTLTWRGDLTDTDLQTVVDSYRANNGYSEGCTFVENHNVIYFQWVPPQLAATVDRIKFVAVNLYAPDEPNDFNHVLAIRTGVHVLYFKDGAVKILPIFIPDSPLGIQTGTAPVDLYNNDGLLMGQVQTNGSLIRVERADDIRYGIPLKFSIKRTVGSLWVRVYANNIAIAPERFADVLPPDLQADFMEAFSKDLMAGQTLNSVVWISAPPDFEVNDVRVSVDAYQTLWDMSSVPMTLKVQ